jgi:dGTPase
VAFSPSLAEANLRIKSFLYTRMYRHWRLRRMAGKAKRLTRELFGLFYADPMLLPDEWRERAGAAGSARAAQVVCDYIAGMTDRFAMDEHRRLTDPFVSS